MTMTELYCYWGQEREGIISMFIINVGLHMPLAFMLFFFCGIGLVLGRAAQAVVNEHERKRESEILEEYRDDVVDSPEPESVDEDAESSEIYDAQLAD